MSKNHKFYTEIAPGFEHKYLWDQQYVGKAAQFPNLSYGPVKTRDAALNGIKRLVAKEAKRKEHAAVKTMLFPPVKKPIVNHVAYVLDISGSMFTAGIMQHAVDSLNQNMRQLAQESKAMGQETLVSVVLFGDRPRLVRNSTPISMVSDISMYECGAGENTALYDGIVEGIHCLERILVRDNADNAYLVMTITDGQENGQSRSSRQALAVAIDEHQRRGNWTFTFLMPQGGRCYLDGLGVLPGNITEWETTAKGVEGYTQANAAGFSSYVSARSTGKTATTSFYQPDLSKVTAKDLAKMVDLTSKVKTLHVDAEAPIKEFVESKLKWYQPGTCYIALTKKEKELQAYKQILVRDRTTKRVYGGYDARKILGIPEGQDMKIEPGNHANFDVFFQSTSLNRILVRGTDVLVLQ